MRLLIFIWYAGIITLLGFLTLSKLQSIKTPLNILSPLPRTVPSRTPLVKSVFVPYWTLADGINSQQYNTVIYFSITPDGRGIDLKSDGYNNLRNFLKIFEKAEKKLLTVQMTNDDYNSQILNQPDLQEKVADEALKLSAENGFNGILLDFEYSGLPFSSLTNAVTNLHTRFAQKAHQKKQQFYSAIYADAFYRARPYNISEIGKKSDGIYIMAYNFHKTLGDPGANFPLAADDYDFKIMIDDFLKDVSPDKITVIFGMYGYDWPVNEKGQSIGPGKPITLREIKAKFSGNCSYQNCKIKRDSQSSESEITYTAENTNHILWYEDIPSTENKSAYLQNKGINSIAYWAYSYF